MNLARLDLNLVVALRALLEERNVTRAGQRVGLSQPATSAALARLRRHFDDDLQCVDRHVARLEAETLLTARARRVGHLELAGEPRRHLTNTLRSWASLPVRIRPAS